MFKRIIRYFEGHPKAKFFWWRFAMTVLVLAVAISGPGTGDVAPDLFFAFIVASFALNVFAVFAVLAIAFVALVALAILDIVPASLVSVVLVVFAVLVVLAVVLVVTFGALDYAKKNDLTKKYVFCVLAAQFVLTFTPMYWYLSTH